MDAVGGADPGLGSNTFYQIQIQIQIFFFRGFKYKYKYKYTGKNLIKYKYKYKYSSSNTNTNTNTHRGRYKIAAILQMTYIQIHSIVRKLFYLFKFHLIVSKSPIYNEPALIQIMAWHWVCNKPLSDQ